MVKKTLYSWQDIHGFCQELGRQASIDKWIPDYVVGLTRGGLIPATILSHWFQCGMHTLDVRLRDGSGNLESNCWMPEHAIGYIEPGSRPTGGCRYDPIFRKRILIVDDINDSGSTLNWIKQDWQASCMPGDGVWDTVWGNNVRVAVLFNKESSKSQLPVHYSAVDITETNDPGWIVFPWEI
jgi:hypoxanthine phosphoribosyltransferase